MKNLSRSYIIRNNRRTGEDGVGISWKKKKKKFRSLYGYTHDKIEIFGGQYAETIKK